MTTRVERPVTREQHSVSQQTVAGRTPGPARSFVVAAVFADFARAVEGGDPPAQDRLVDPVAPTRDVAKGRGVRVCATESRPAARADLTGSLTSRSTEERSSVPVAHAGPAASETPRRPMRPPTAAGDADQT